MAIKHFFLCLVISITVTAVQGATYREIGDAGETLASAARVPGPGPYALNRISGFLAPSQADLFRIYVSGGPFGATTVTNTSSFFDTQLFLFDEQGHGIFANDDDASLPPQSTIFAPGTLSAGWYYLGIAAFGYDPVSSGGLIFPPVDNFLVLSTDLRSATGPGGASPLTGFTGVSSEGGAYAIELTGVQTVPEPSSAALVSLACGCILLRRRLRN